MCLARSSAVFCVGHRRRSIHLSLEGLYVLQRHSRHTRPPKYRLKNHLASWLDKLKLVTKSAGNTKYIIHTHTRLTALCPGLPGWAGTRKEKPIWILLKRQTVSSSGIRWAICKSAPGSSQVTTPVPHHSVFYRPDALPAAQSTASKHWRQNIIQII